MKKDLFDYFGEEFVSVEQPNKVVAIVVPEVEDDNFDGDDSDFDGDDTSDADGDDFYDADGDFSEARGRRKARKKAKRGARKVKRSAKRVARKSKRKPIRPVSLKNTRVISLGAGSKTNFNKRVMKALDEDKFYNAGGSPSVEFGI